MNKEQHLTKPKAEEHGTLMSYVVGFILSLIFTIIPYLLVVDKILTGNALVIAILGIAVIQMIIQMFFFLHLGRGPKPLYNVVFFFATGGTIVVVISASLFIMNNLYRNMLPEEVIRMKAQEEGIAQVGGKETGACQGNKESHIVTIKDGMANPIHTQADMCDTLTIINEDDEAREIVFGSPPNYGSYGGEFEIGLKKGDPETLTLNQSGDFMFRDRIDLDFAGYFSVEP